MRLARHDCFAMRNLLRLQRHHTGGPLNREQRRRSFDTGVWDAIGSCKGFALDRFAHVARGEVFPRHRGPRAGIEFHRHVANSRADAPIAQQIRLSPAAPDDRVSEIGFRSIRRSQLNNQKGSGRTSPGNWRSAHLPFPPRCSRHQSGAPDLPLEIEKQRGPRTHDNTHFVHGVASSIARRPSFQIGTSILKGRSASLDSIIIEETGFI